jgi:hypothetical protein
VSLARFKYISKIQIAPQAELNGDLRFAIHADGRDVFNGFDLRDAVFKALGDATLNHAGGSAAIVGFHRHDGRFDVGILADLESRVGHDAKGDEDEVHHHRQHGTTHRCIREPHVRESSWRVVRG